MKYRTLAALLAVLLAAGCGGGEGARGSEALDTTMGMGRVHRHSEMPGMLMLPRVRSALDSMVAAEGAPTGAAVTSHAELIREMVQTMERDRRDMALRADPAWSALADSVRSDLAGFAGATAPEPAAFRAHLERVQRLLALYQGLH
jgi:hypothetical protein